MPRTYVRKSLRATCYTPSSLLAAVEEIESNKLTIYAAAKKYEIPISTLHDRVRKKTGLKSKTLGRPTVIPFEDEQKLANALRALEKWGFGLSRDEVLDIVAEYVRLGKIKTPFKDHRPGPDWFIGFRQRHRLSIKKPQSVEYVRKKNTEPFLINEYFDLLDQTLRTLDLRDTPSRIWNLDETSVSLDPSKTKVVGGIGLPCSRTTYGSGKENVTVLACVNADGKKLSPLIVFKGKHVWDQWMAEDKDEYDFELSYAASKKGWMESQIFYNYIKDIFIPSLGEERPVLLIYDGHSTHVDVNVVELAIRNNVTILKLPPHTSHLLQPLDLAVFKSFKSSWDAKMCVWQRTHNGLKMLKKEFAEMLADVWHKTKDEVIQNGFRKGGIYPYNRNVISVDKYDPAVYARWLKHTSSPKTLIKMCTEAINKLFENDFSTRKQKMPEKETEGEHKDNDEINTNLRNESISLGILQTECRDSPEEVDTQEKPLQKINILSNVVIEPAQSVSFEELLLKKMQQSKRVNTNIKKKRLTTGAEVITKAAANKILLEKKSKAIPKKPKTTATKTAAKNVDFNTLVNGVDNSLPSNRNPVVDAVPGPSGVFNTRPKAKKDEKLQETKLQKLNILTERKANILSTPKGKGIGKKTCASKENILHSGVLNHTCPAVNVYGKHRPKIRRLNSKDTDSTTSVSGSLSEHSDSDFLDYPTDICIESEDEVNTVNFVQLLSENIEKSDRAMQVKKELTATKDVIKQQEHEQQQHNNETMRERKRKKTEKDNTSEEVSRGITKANTFSAKDIKQRETITELKYHKTIIDKKTEQDVVGYCVGDGVLVRYYKRKAWKYYVGLIEKIIEKEYETYYTVRYLKYVKKPKAKFILTRQIDRDEITDVLIQKKVVLLSNPKNSKEFYLQDETDILIYF